jgi:microcystin-dependent protein
MSFGFAPKGWAFCNCQLLPINQNQALFLLLGTTYGGDGRINFGIPNLQGRVPTSTGSGLTLGQVGGEQAHTLSISEIPTHTHVANASPQNANVPAPANAVFGAAAGAYAPAQSLTSLVPGTLAQTGGSQPHNNMQPYLTLNFCIALQGIFPSQN